MTNKKPLIDIEDKAPDVRTTLSLRPEEDQDLKLYSEYTQGSSINHIVRACVRRTLSADKGFQEFKANRAGVVTLSPVEPAGEKRRKETSGEASQVA